MRDSDGLDVVMYPDRSFEDLSQLFLQSWNYMKLHEILPVVLILCVKPFMIPVGICRGNQMDSKETASAHYKASTLQSADNENNRNVYQKMICYNMFWA